MVSLGLRETGEYRRMAEMTKPDKKDDMTPINQEPVVELALRSNETVGDVRCANPFMIAEKVDVYYGDNHAIKDVTLEIAKNQVIALIGPSGCGKSTFLRCLNRMNDSIDSARVTGTITLDGQDIYEQEGSIPSRCGHE